MEYECISIAFILAYKVVSDDGGRDHDMGEMQRPET